VIQDPGLIMAVAGKELKEAQKAHFERYSYIFPEGRRNL